MIKIPPSIKDKILKDHDVVPDQVAEAFRRRNPDGDYLVDDREGNRTTPETEWFIASIAGGRLLKVCFIYDEDTGDVNIKTAYDANDVEIGIYCRVNGLNKIDL